MVAKDYVGYYFLINEFGKLKAIINANYGCQMLPKNIYIAIVNRRRECKKILEKKYDNYKYKETIGGNTIFLN